MEDKKEIYIDSEGTEYLLGDIVFNPFLGDYWLVEEYTEQEKQEWDADCDYCLSLYGDKNIYSVDLNMPSGFKIIKRKGEPEYDDLLAELRSIAEKMQIED